MTSPPPAAGPGERALYEELYQQAPCGYLSTSIDGVVTHVNDTLLDWTGLARDELVGLRRFTDVLAPGGRLFYETHQLAQLQRTGELRGAALELVRSDGSRMPVLFSSVVVELESGERAIRTTLFDAAERTAYERALVDARTRAEDAAQRLRTLQLVTEACAEARAALPLADAVVGALRSAAGTAGAAIWLRRDGDGALARVAGDPSVADPPEPMAATGTACITTTGARTAVHVPVAGSPGAGGVLGWEVHPGYDVGDDDLALYRTAAALVGQALHRAELHAELERRAHHDELTGLPNRALLRDRFDGVAARVRRSRRHLAVLVIDVDGFKAVNDRCGHSAGDDVLVELGRRMRGLVRDGDTVARLGGDEFAVLCEDADEATAAAIARRLELALDLEVAAPDGALWVGASVGVATRAPGDDTGLDDLLEQADRRMYERKRGRDRAALRCITGAVADG